jgi:hypothetical protein
MLDESPAAHFEAAAIPNDNTTWAHASATRFGSGIDQFSDPTIHPPADGSAAASSSRWNGWDDGGEVVGRAGSLGGLIVAAAAILK